MHYSVVYYIPLVSCLTLGKVDVGAPVLGPVLRLEVLHEPAHRLLARRDQVDGLHGRKGLAVLVDRLHDCEWRERERDA